ncbi:hypothetical protein IAT38_001151 [Cryptococcus sp. DSM 104549]
MSQRIFIDNLDDLSKAAGRTSPSSFTPKYPQPFTLVEAINLEVDTLVAEIYRLINSIQHLYETQDELVAFRDSEEGQEDPEAAEVANEAYMENEDLIPRQSERIALISAALISKIGPDMPLGHHGWKVGDVFARYGRDPNRRKWWESDAPGQAEGAPQAEVAAAAAGEGGAEEEGLHL